MIQMEFFDHLKNLVFIHISHGFHGKNFTCSNNQFMNMHLYEYRHMCMYIHMYIYLYIHIYLCVYTYTNCICLNEYICVWIYRNVWIYRLEDNSEMMDLYSFCVNHWSLVMSSYFCNLFNSFLKLEFVNLKDAFFLYCSDYSFLN